MLVCLLGPLGLGSAAMANLSDASMKPYQQIAEINIFRLKSPTIAAPDLPARPTLPRVVLAGMTTIIGKRALLKVQFPANPPEPAVEKAYILAEGQRDGSIEVLEINEEAGSVKLRLFDTELVLTFDKDGTQLPTPAPPHAPPPLPPRPAPLAQH